MANLNDENNTTYSSLGSGSTVSDANALVVETDGATPDISVFVDDGSGGAPSDFTLIAERHSPAEDRWMEFGRDSITGASNPQSFTDVAVPDQFRYKITNDSASAADFRVNVVSYTY